MDGDVRVRQLDVTDEKGILNLAREVEEERGSTSWSTTPGSPWFVSAAWTPTSTW